MLTDPLSDILALLNAHCLLSGRLIAGGDWSIKFPRPDAVKVSVVLKGKCWLLLENGSAPVQLEAGDVVMLNGHHPTILASDLALEPVDAVATFRALGVDVARLGTSEEFYYVGGHVALDPAGADMLRDALPPLIHLRRGAPEAGVVAWLLDQLYDEMHAARPGAALATAQIAQLIFVQILRSHIGSMDAGATGWLRAMADPRVASALKLMHAEPGRDWQLGELARAVGMSRTSFALRFRKVAGMAPLAYLAEWRMRLARRALKDGEAVSTVAHTLGYSSESAFSHAFKRLTGSSPRAFRDSQRDLADARTTDLSMPEPNATMLRLAS
ncbi:MAG: transcriptional regulator, AraC family [Rhizobium sp.]|nr:transcriptional regulator, AraC family [Rhizobium sp.]